MRASVACTGPQFSLLEPFPHKQLIAYHGSNKWQQEAFVNLLDKQEEKNTEDRTLGATLTIGIRCGVKLTVTLEPEASASPCSISGTA